MKPLTRELLQKELRLQRGPMLFTLAVVVLGAVVLLMLAVTRQDLAGFSTDELRAALYTTALLPILVFILPLMIGSTAAAEKSMGVLAWQAALPASPRITYGIKVAIVALLCAVVGGVLPYLLQLAIPSGEHSIMWVFRDAWPGWCSLLCGAIGFYSGSVAIDDYQGLLISAVPVAALIFVMGLADPSGLVFPGPFGYPESIWKDWAVALRLLIIAGVFVWFGVRLLAQGRQWRRRQLLRHGFTIAVITFGLTLWNVVTERSLLQTPASNEFGFRPEMWPMDSDMVAFSFPQKLATVGDSNGRDFRGSLELQTEKEWLDDRMQFGAVHRISGGAWSSPKGSTRHTFNITNEERIHEFPQSPNLYLTGWTADGRWILGLKPDSTQKTICGPFGLAITSAIMPDSWFDILQESFDFSPIKPTYSDFILQGNSIPPNMIDEPVLASTDGQPELLVNGQRDSRYQTGPNDVIASTADRGIIWKDGGKELGAGERKTLRKRWLHISDNAFVVPIENASGTTTTAILKPTNKSGIFETAGWVRGEVEAVTKDYRWAQLPVEDNVISFRRLESRIQAGAETTGTAAPKGWEINRLRHDDGTTLTLFGWLNEVPVKTPSGEPHIWFSYRKFAPVHASKNILHPNFPFESGVMVFNLESGNESFIPIAMPWPAEATMLLQGAIPETSAKTYGFGWPGFTWDKSGRLAVIQNSYVAVTRFKSGRLEPGSMKTIYSYIPGLKTEINSDALLRPDMYLLTDYTSLWMVRLDWARP